MSIESRIKIRNANIGKKHSSVTKLKMSKAQLDNKNALGSKRSDEHKAKISISNKGKKLSEEHKNKISKSKIGTKVTWGDKISKTLQGREFTKEHKKHISEGLIKQFNISNELKYQRIHKHIRNTLGKPSKCENCGTTESKVFDWANISHKYKYDLNDWIRLCRSCHVKYDKHNIVLNKITIGVIK